MAKQEFKNLVGYDSEGSVAARGDAPPVRPGGGRLGEVAAVSVQASGSAKARGTVFAGDDPVGASRGESARRRQAREPPRSRARRRCHSSRRPSHGCTLVPQLPALVGLPGCPAFAAVREVSAGRGLADPPARAAGRWRAGA